MRRETRHLIAGLMPAAFALGMACLYWSAWLRPGRWDPEQLLDLARLVLFQALLIHAGAFLTLVQIMPTRNGAAGLLAGLAGGYGFFAFVFSFMIGSIWPLVVFGGTLVAELPQLLVRQAEWVPADKKTERVACGLAARSGPEGPLRDRVACFTRWGEGCLTVGTGRG